ncbi:MAG: DUF4129 domain-containing protein [Oscillospiraceae bacterium]
MGQYLKNSIADFVLCTCITLALVPAVCSGFVLTDALSGSVIAVLLLSAVLTFLLVLLSRSRKATWLGIAAAFVLAVVGLVYINVYRPFTDETANSAFIFVLVQVITAVLVWLLTRSRPGTVVLFLIGTILCAGAHFLQFPIPAWCLFLFLLAVSASFLYRVYTVSLQKADIISGSQKTYLRQTAIVAMIVMLLAGGVFFGVVRPLNPPTLELKLITVLKSMQQLDRLGVSSTEIVLDPNLESAEEPEDEEKGNEENEEESDSPQGVNDIPQTSLTESIRENVTSAVQQTWAAVRYDQHNFQWLWLLLLIPAAIAAAYLWRFEHRKRWRKRVQALPRECAVVNYYRYFLKRLSRLGLKRSENATLREYAALNEVQLQPFEGEDCRFADLTATYESVLYGRHRVTDREYAAYEAFFDGFYPGLKKELGPVRYWLKAFQY